MERKPAGDSPEMSREGTSAWSLSCWLDHTDLLMKEGIRIEAEIRQLLEASPQELNQTLVQGILKIIEGLEHLEGLERNNIKRSTRGTRHKNQDLVRSYEGLNQELEKIYVELKVCEGGFKAVAEKVRELYQKLLCLNTQLKQLIDQLTPGLDQGKWQGQPLEENIIRGRIETLLISAKRLHPDQLPCMGFLDRGETVYLQLEQAVLLTIPLVQQGLNYATDKKRRSLESGKANTVKGLRETWRTLL